MLHTVKGVGREMYCGRMGVVGMGSWKGVTLGGEGNSCGCMEYRVYMPPEKYFTTAPLESAIFGTMNFVPVPSLVCCCPRENDFLGI